MNVDPLRGQRRLARIAIGAKLPTIIERRLVEGCDFGGIVGVVRDRAERWQIRHEKITRASGGESFHQSANATRRSRRARGAVIIE